MSQILNIQFLKKYNIQRSLIKKLIGAKLVQFWILITFSSTKSKFKGGIFYGKNCCLLKLGFHMVGRFGQTHGCPSQIWPDQMFWSFCVLIQNNFESQFESFFISNNGETVELR